MSDPNRNKTITLIGLGFAAFLLAVAVFNFYDETTTIHVETSTSRRDRICKNNGGNPLHQANEIIRQQLVSPSTAEFPLAHENGVSVEHEPFPYECMWSISSYVDAQNAFGGMLRKEFSLFISYDPRDDSWTPVALVFE